MAPIHVQTVGAHMLYNEIFHIKIDVRNILACDGNDLLSCDYLVLSVAVTVTVSAVAKSAGMPLTIHPKTTAPSGAI